jgi:hypothetical protein
MVTLSLISNVTWSNATPTGLNYTRMNGVVDEEQWPLERIVSIVVPFCFGIIGLAGLLGNALVVMGEYFYKALKNIKPFFIFVFFFRLSQYLILTSLR